MHYYRRLRFAVSCRTNPPKDPGAVQTRKKTNKGITRKQFQGFVSALIAFCLLLQSISPALAATFTAGMAKRDAPGPFAAAPIVQGNYGNSGTSDLLTHSRGNQISGNFYQNFDSNQFSVVLWWTPETDSTSITLPATLVELGNALQTYIWYEYNTQRFRFSNGATSYILNYPISAGTTYNLVFRADNKNALDNTNYYSFSVNDVHSYSFSSSQTPPAPVSNASVGSRTNSTYVNNGIIEGLTIYRRPLYDGTYGIDVGNGDEIAQIYNSGAGKDPTLVTGSWDVVFALPTNSSPGALTTGTGNAWSHPHSSNLLYTSTTNTGGFMMNGDYAADGWSPYGALATQNGVGSSLDFNVGENDYAKVNDSASLDISSAVTVTVWAKKSDITATTRHLVNKGIRFGNVANNYVLLNDGANRIQFHVSDGLTSHQVASTASINDTDWHFFTGVFEPGVATRIYIDGELEGSNTTNVPSTLTTNDNELRFGSNSTSGERWAGNMSDVKVYNRALTQQELTDLMYKKTLTSEEEIDLVGWWKMDEGNGQTVGDSSDEGNHGTLGANSSVGADDPTWSTDAPVPSISALSTSEKIFAGGYKATSSAADAGIVRGVTGQAVGQNYVVRALANSDGTSIPKVVIWDTTNNAEITSLTGTNTSTRTDPDNLIFTFELPTVARNGVAADSTGFEVRLINTEDSGTTYWHQVEVLPNLIDNPSMETGSGDPWIPDGWSNQFVITGDTSQEVTTVHSGLSSIKVNPLDHQNNACVYTSFASTSGKFVSMGGFFNGLNPVVGWGLKAPVHGLPHYANGGPSLRYAPNSLSWIHQAYVGRTIATSIQYGNCFLDDLINSKYLDDNYVINLSDVSLTVTPASQADSTENTDEIRVDGRDTYVASSAEAVSLGTGSGYVSFNYRPRHAAADMVKFAETTSDDAYVVSLAGDADDYVNVFWDSTNTLKMEYSMNGATASSTWDATSAIAANSEYDMALNYTGGSTMTLAVDGTARITLSGIPSAFGIAPNTVYFGSNTSGANQGDATFSDFIFDNTAPSISLTALSPDPNSDNTPTLTGTANEAIGTVTAAQFQMDGTGGSWSSCSANDGTFNSASEAFSCTPSALSDGSHTMYVKATDSNGNTTVGGSEVSDIFVIDTTAPSIPGTPATTTPTADTTPTWSWTASTDATSGLAAPAYTVEWSQDSSFSDGVSSSTSNTTSFTHTTPLGDATWYVRVKATDAAGNQSAWSATGSVQINTGAPTGSVSINAGSGFTNSRSVTLTLSASSGFFSGTGDIQMKLSNLADLSDGAWEAFAASKPWTLAEGDGTKTVYVQFKDATGNESGAYTDTIVLDTLAPNEATELSPGNNHTSNSERPTFSFKPATDAASGINRYKLVVDNPGDTGFSLDSIAPQRSEPDTQPRYTVTYAGFGDDSADNDRIHITTKSSTAWGLSDNDGKLTEGVATWSIVAVDNAGNERITSHRYILDRTNPRLSVDSIGSTPITSSYMATSDVTPTLQGTLTDPLSGVDTSQAQSEHGPKVASGPRSVEVTIEKRMHYTYQPYLVYSLTLDDSFWTCDDKAITDNTKHQCDKYAPFTFAPPQALEQGSYRVTLTGIDSASNRSTDSQLTLDIVPYTTLTTPQEQVVIEETIAKEAPEITEEESEEITQELEIALPTDAPLTREVADRGAGVITTTIEALGNAAKTIITTSGNALTTVAKTTTAIIVNRVKFVANIGTSVANLTSRVVTHLAQGIYIGSTRQLAFIVRSVRSAYGFVAGNAPGFARSTLQAFGGRMQSLADQAVAVGSAAQAQVTSITQTVSEVSKAGNEAVASVLFALGEQAQNVSERAGFALVKLGYNFVTEPTAISNVAVEILSPTTVKISWDTNHPANGKVNWGFASGQYEFEAQTSKRTNFHEFILENLEPGTNYHYEVMSQNKNYVYDANREFQTPPVQ